MDSVNFSYAELSASGFAMYPRQSGVANGSTATDSAQTPGNSGGSGAAPPTVLPISNQQGIQISSGSNQEFVPYGPDGRRAAAGHPSASSAKTPKQAGGGTQSDPGTEQIVEHLRATEEKVKAHEAAHKAAGGTLTGPVSYTYTRGPDGKSYISGGEVQINISSGDTPRETAARMQQVIQAALAPVDPSPQDRSVAARASSIEAQAHQEETGTTTSTGSQGQAVPTGTPANAIPKDTSRDNLTPKAGVPSAGSTPSSGTDLFPSHADQVTVSPGTEQDAAPSASGSTVAPESAPQSIEPSTEKALAALVARLARQSYGDTTATGATEPWQSTVQLNGNEPASSASRTNTGQSRYFVSRELTPGMLTGFEPSQHFSMHA